MSPRQDAEKMLAFGEAKSVVGVEDLVGFVIVQVFRQSNEQGDVDAEQSVSVQVKVSYSVLSLPITRIEVFSNKDFVAG